MTNGDTHVERGGAELDVALDDEAHGFLHVPFGNRESAAGLGQTALGKHLQQVLLLTFQFGYWKLGKRT